MDGQTTIANVAFARTRVGASAKEDVHVAFVARGRIIENGLACVSSRGKIACTLWMILDLRNDYMMVSGSQSSTKAIEQSLAPFISYGRYFLGP